MKVHFGFLMLLLLLLSISVAFAQPPGSGAPSGAGDKTLGDNDVKFRSVELERIKRQSQDAEAASYAPINPKITAQFNQVKDDYEAIQLLQAAIIKAYTKGKTIDYSMIETSATAMNKRGLRLDENLFAPTKKDRTSNESGEKAEKRLLVRDLIVELDNAVGDFVGSKIFGSKVIESDVAIKTRDDLFRVLKYSAKLAEESKQLK